MTSAPFSTRRGRYIFHFTEAGAGGYSRYDGIAQSYDRIHTLLEAIGPRAALLDFGARRRPVFAGLPAHCCLTDLRPHAETVLAVDIDRAVDSNPLLTETRAIHAGGKVTHSGRFHRSRRCRSRVEHVGDPEPDALHLFRVPRPSRWLRARTPHRLGSIGAGARSVPNRLHRTLLRRNQSARAARDVCSTHCRLTARRALTRSFRWRPL